MYTSYKDIEKLYPVEAIHTDSTYPEQYFYRVLKPMKVYKKIFNDNCTKTPVITLILLPDAIFHKNNHNNKCRANYAIQDPACKITGRSSWVGNFKYGPGEILIPRGINHNTVSHNSFMTKQTCHSGIHFFLTKALAADYYL